MNIKRDEEEYLGMLPIGQPEPVRIICGPDVSKWFVFELNKQMRKLWDMVNRSPVGRPPGIGQLFQGVRSMTVFRDWALQINYDDKKGQRWNAKDKKGEVICPINCRRGSVTFFGKCVETHQLENIMFGIGSVAFGLGSAVTHLGQDWAAIWNYGRSDPAVDHDYTSTGRQIGSSLDWGGEADNPNHPPTTTTPLFEEALNDSSVWKNIETLHCDLCPVEVPGPTKDN
jgi:hypothetical protein